MVQLEYRFNVKGSDGGGSNGAVMVPVNAISASTELSGTKQQVLVMLKPLLLCFILALASCLFEITYLNSFKK